MKVYVTDEKELIMEPSIKWAGNPNVLVAAKAFGLKATVQVRSLFFYTMEKILKDFLDNETEPSPVFSFFFVWQPQIVDLQVFVAPRITMKPLVPSFPCFANIFVSLMEKVL